MITDKDYNKLSDVVYTADSLKVKYPLVEGYKIANKSFQVLSVVDNTTNGMQAMAVAPIVSRIHFLAHKSLFG